MRSLLSATAVVLLLAGCSANPYSFEYREITDRSKIIQDPPPGPVTIVARREPALGGSGADNYFTFDGQRIVNLGAHDQYTFHSSAGQHVVGVVCDSPFGIVGNPELPLLAEPNKIYIFRVFTCQINAMTQ